MANGCILGAHWVHIGWFLGGFSEVSVEKLWERCGKVAGLSGKVWVSLWISCGEVLVFCGFLGVDCGFPVEKSALSVDNSAVFVDKSVEDCGKDVEKLLD